jgi:ATP diphosphatase
VPASLPALVGAYRITQKAAGVGFDWPDARAVLAKLDEELHELRRALAGGEPPAAAAEEVGDVLFTVANLARKLGVDPEAALAQSNLKFRRRFAQVEEDLERRGRKLGEASLEELDELWERAKSREGAV